MFNHKVYFSLFSILVSLNFHTLSFAQSRVLLDENENQNQSQSQTTECIENDLFPHEVAVAAQNVMKRHPEWTFTHMKSREDHYFPGVAHDLVSQKPRIAKYFTVDSYYNYKNNTGSRLKVYMGWLAVCVYGEDAKTSLAFKDEINKEIADNSYFKGKVIDLHETGRFVVRDSGLESYNYSWDSLILPSEQKARIKNTMEDFLNNFDHATNTKWGIPLSRGVLLYGAPGNGKSFLSKVLMTQVVNNSFKNKVTFILVTARNVSSVKAISTLYNAARRFAPSIVFIEDIDLIVGTSRNNRQEVKNEFLQQLNGVQELEGVLTVGTTNLASKLDPALIRSKRLGYHFHIKTPDFDERIDLMKSFTNKCVNAPDVTYERLAGSMAEASGADMKELADLAIEIAVKENSIDMKSNKPLITKAVFQKALARRNQTKLH